MNMRRATDYEKRAVDKAVELLREALICAKTGNCPKLCRRIRLALTSGGGAQRHVRHRVSRTRDGTLVVSRADRECIGHVESPARPYWFNNPNL